MPYVKDIHVVKPWVFTQWKLSLVSGSPKPVQGMNVKQGKIVSFYDTPFNKPYHSDLFIEMNVDKYL